MRGAAAVLLRQRHLDAIVEPSDIFPAQLAGS
jgi:hypothetical protein